MKKNVYNYLIEDIRSHYKAFDRAHDERHFDEVFYFIKDMLPKIEIKESDLRYDMMLIAAAYHDVGRACSDRDHELVSAIMLENDMFLKRYYTPQLISEASNIIKKHRKSKFKTEECNELEALLRLADSVSEMDDHRALYRVITYQVDHYEERSGKPLHTINADRIYDLALDQLKRKPIKFYPHTVSRLAWYMDDICDHIPEKKEIMKVVREVIRENNFISQI